MMTKKELKKWLPEITHWINGGELYVYDPIDDTWDIKTAQTFRVDQIYVIKDKHFEARKAFTLGEKIECRFDGEWQGCDAPTWAQSVKHRPKPKEPIYEWQWAYKKDEKYCLTDEFYTNPNVTYWTKFEPSRRLKKMDGKKTFNPMFLSEIG